MLDMFRVEEVNQCKTGVEVRGGDSVSYTCSNVIVCTGPWSRKLLSETGLDLPLRSMKASVLYFPIKDDCHPPAVNTMAEFKDGHYFSITGIDYPGLVKVGLM